MKFIFTISFLFLFGNLFSQKDIVIKSKVSENEIQLRWTPTKADLFLSAMKNGFTIQRKEWNGSGIPTADFWTSGVDYEMKLSVPIKNDSVWKKEFIKNEEAGILFSFIYPEKPRTKLEDENLFGLTLLSLDLNPSLAKLANVYWKDSLLEKGKIYAYKIEINTLKKLEVMVVNTNLPTQLPMIKEFDLKDVNKSVEVSWNFKNYQTNYTGYFIERSEDSLNFIRMNERALLPMASQYEKNKEITFYQDTSVKENKNYWYRLVGKDHFGETGLPSFSKKIKINPIFRGELVIDTLFETKNNTAKLKWNFTNQKDKVAAQSIRLYRSKTINGKYELWKELNENEIEFEVFERENYFKIVAENESQKVESWPSLLLIPDRFPPAIPDSLTGKIDRNGKVILSWKKNTEKDLIGYRVFYTNALHEEMVEKSKKYVLKNSFEDSVDIHNLNEEIYFSVNAVDSNHNNSKLSVPVKLQKPDYIAPVGAPIISVFPNETGNLIRWNHSTSTDVSKTELRRSANGKMFERVFSCTDTTQNFLDTLILPEKGYYYRTVVIDDANNFTESESVYLENSRMKIKVFDSVSITVNRKDKFILLKWIPISDEVYSYTIYKAKKGEMLRSYKTVEGNTYELKDRELYISNEYVYAIKAVLKSGRELMVKKEITVIY